MPVTNKITMPLVFHKNIGPCEVMLWRIGESAEELAALCGGADALYAQRFGTEKRRREWLAWHAALRATAPDARAEYNAQGAPVLTDGRYISISHAGGFVAVIISEKHPCGIDIESKVRDFSRVVPRITTERERRSAMATGYPENEAFAMLWCSKEALYKWAGEERVSFAKEITVTDIDRTTGILRGNVRGRTAELHVFFEDGLCIGCCWG